MLRRADFEACGGFEPGHRLEDVALGIRLAERGRRIRLDPALQATHLKQWTLRSMIRADLFSRALPWSRMLLDPAERVRPETLSAGRTGRISVIFTGLLTLCLLLSPWFPVLLVAAAAGLVGLMACNAGFLGLVQRRLGPRAAVQGLAVLWVHYLCAGTGYALALGERLSLRAVSALRSRARGG